MNEKEKKILEKHKIELLHMETKDRLLYENKNGISKDVLKDLGDIAGKDAKVESITVAYKNDEIQKIAKTKTNEFLVTLEQFKDKDEMILTRIVEKSNPEDVLLEYTNDDYYRGIIEIVNIFFKDLGKRDPTLIGYKKMEKK